MKNLSLSIAEQIKVLCICQGISIADLASRLGTTPQNLYAKLKRQKFSVKELQKIAEATACSYEQYFLLPDGKKI
jgi:hypothetical protein